MIKMIQMCLQLHGHEVLSANNGQEALDIAATQAPDLVLMDVMMPQMDGLDALKRLKDDRATTHLPVIMLTAKGEAEDIVRSLQAGADLHLAKPFSCEELITIIKRMYDT